MTALALAAALALASGGPTRDAPTPTATPAPPPAAPAAPAGPPPAPGAPSGADGGSRATPAPGEGAGAELERLAARELPALPLRVFRTPAGIEGRVEGAAPPKVKALEGAEEVEVSLGTAQPLSCTIFSTRVDAAAQIWQFAEEAKKGVTLVAARPTAAAVVEGSPLLFAEIVYLVDGPERRLAGLAKLAVLAHDTRSMLCVHDELGYSKAFERIVKGIAGALRGGGADERAGARFAEVELMRIGDLPIGFNERVVWDREGGGRVVRQHTAQLLPRGPTELFALDSVSAEVVDAKDLLEEGAFSHGANGELDAAMKLTRAEDGTTYAYEGEKDGKRLEGKFATQAGLSTDLWFARRLHAKAPPQKELRHEAYSMQANPVAPLPVVYRADPAAGARRVKMEIGPVRLDGEVDADGLLRVAELPVGPARLVVERAWSRGTP